MKFLPFENIVYQSGLNVEENLRRLNEVIEPEKNFRWTGIFASKDHKPYEGTLKENEFKIRRILHYRNSFQPVIEGVIDEKVDGSTIKIKMRLHLLVIGFMIVWFIFMMSFFTGSEMFTFDKEDYFSSFFPVILLVFGYIITMGGFKYESIKTKKYLKELFEAEMKE